MNEFICEFSLGDADGLTIALRDSIDIAGYPNQAAGREDAAATPAAANAQDNNRR
ncbi:MAG: hypothetical protein ACRYHA_02130 [Janthinobacterium lividum]